MSVRNAVSGILSQVKNSESIELRMLGQEMKIVGVSFEGRQSHIGNIDSRTKIKLVREPHNVYDPNKAAIAVVCEDSGVKLGYISRKYNVALSRLMDKGEKLTARIKRVITALGTDTNGVVIVVDKEK